MRSLPLRPEAPPRFLQIRFAHRAATPSLAAAALYSAALVLSDPFALLEPEMVKFAPNFCSCAVDQEKAVFQWKRAVSGPSALLGPEVPKFASNFRYCAVDQEKADFK